MCLTNTLYVIRATHFCVIASINRGPRGILCTRGEKARTSIKVSGIAPDNAISKAQCAPRGRDTE